MYHPRSQKVNIFLMTSSQKMDKLANLKLTNKKKVKCIPSEKKKKQWDSLNNL